MEDEDPRQERDWHDEFRRLALESTRSPGPGMSLRAAELYRDRTGADMIESLEAARWQYQTGERARRRPFWLNRISEGLVPVRRYLYGDPMVPTERELWIRRRHPPRIPGGLPRGIGQEMLISLDPTHPEHARVVRQRAEREQRLAEQRAIDRKLAIRYAAMDAYVVMACLAIALIALAWIMDP